MRGKQKNAIYLRLSIEDGATNVENRNQRDESNSISSQRRMLKEYISKEAELAGQETVEFCDDGFSGTNMERPGMQELLKEVKQGKISCILVKDLSRFSRDYIELGTYLNQIFPFMGVRFIAVNDHYDSREHGGSTIEIDTAFRTLLYDLYSKDISGKVKSAFESKCENGEYVFGQVPFGYEKSKTKKHMVVVKESEAEIVRRIFAMAEEGMSSTQIAKKLHEEQVSTSSQMRHPQRKAAKEHCSWNHEMVRNILNNRFYLGEMAYGKTVRKFVGSKTGVLMPREDWKVHPNHHEALITPEVFERVSIFRPGQSTKRKREKHPLVGKIYCGGCGYAISYKPQRNGKIPRNSSCRKNSLLQIPECCTYFNATVLEEIVLNEMYRELMRQGELIRQRESLEKFQKEELRRLGEEKRVCKEECCKLQKEKAALYECYALGELGVAEYQKESDKKELQIRELSCKMKEIGEEYDRIEEEYQSPKMDMKQIIRFMGMKQLTQEVVDVFIERVTVYREKRVEIEWKFGEIGINLT